jgi:hypothetical protein
VDEDPHPMAFNFVSSTPTAQDCGLKPLPPYVVFENRQVLPRAFVVPRAEPLPERGILPKLKATDFRGMVLLEDFEPRESLASDDGSRDAKIVRYLPNRVEVEVAGDSPGFLVLTDIWFPGWQSFVDGRASRLYRANFLFRAVEVPAGSHRVEFRFLPESYRQGKIVSLVSCAVLICLTALGLVSRLIRSRAVNLFTRLWGGPAA